MDPLDALLERPSVVGRSLSLLIRNPAPERVPEILDGAHRLLGRRRQADEIALLLAAPPPAWPAARCGARRVRLLIRSDAAAGAALAWAFTVCRAPLLALWNGEPGPESATLAGLLESLESADAAYLRRRRRGGIDRGYGLFAFAARHIFGVPLPDPGAPLRAYRRAAIAGIALQTEGDLVDFELAAKLTFLTTLLADDLVANEPVAKSARLGRMLWRERAALRRLAATAEFWSGARRPPLASPATVADPRPPAGAPPRRAPRPRFTSRTLAERLGKK